MLERGLFHIHVSNARGPILHVLQSRLKVFSEVKLSNIAPSSACCEKLKWEQGNGAIPENALRSPFPEIRSCWRISLQIISNMQVGDSNRCQGKIKNWGTEELKNCAVMRKGRKCETIYIFIWIFIAWNSEKAKGRSCGSASDEAIWNPSQEKVITEPLIQLLRGKFPFLPYSRGSALIIITVWEPGVRFASRTNISMNNKPKLHLRPFSHRA